MTSSFLAGSVGANPVIIRTVMGKLKGAGIITISRGRSGITLAKKLSEITFYDVYRAAECVNGKGLFHFHENPCADCPVGKNIHSAMQSRLQSVQDAMEKQMKAITIADVAADIRKKIQAVGRGSSQSAESQADGRFQGGGPLSQENRMKQKMTQSERLDFLVEKFKADSVRYKDVKTPDDQAGKRRLLRSLMNIRMPKPVPDEVLAVQDEYLSQRAEENGVVALSDIPIRRDCISVWQGDITRLAADAIVNAANSQMLGCFVPMHLCIDNCIHTYAGIQLRQECSRQMSRLRAEYGEAYEQPTAVPMLTDAYNLPAKKVIHIVGPIVRDCLTPALERDLAACYRNTLDLCLENGLKSVAFCCISTGVFRFPNRRAAEIAVQTVTEWLAGHRGQTERVIFNVFKDEDRRYYEELV